MIREILSRWFPYIGYKNKIRVGTFVKNLVSSWTRSNETNFLTSGAPGESINEITEALEGCLTQNVDTSILKVSAIGCYLSGWMLGFSYFGYNRNINELTNLVRCYLHVDFILDSSSDEMKKDLIEKVGKILTSDLQNLRAGHDVDPDLEHLHPSFKFYRRMVDKKLERVERLFDLFRSEVKSVKIQSSNDLPRETYLEMAREKGEHTGLLFAAVLDVPITDNEENFKQFKLMGYACQLLDDIVDLFKDQADGITTIATHDLEKFGNIDELFKLTLRLVDQFDPLYNFIRYGFMMVLTHAVSRPDNIFSLELRRLVDPYIYIDYRYFGEIEGMFTEMF